LGSLEDLPGPPPGGWQGRTVCTDTGRRRRGCAFAGGPGEGTGGVVDGSLCRTLRDQLLRIGDHLLLTCRVERMHLAAEGLAPGGEHWGRVELELDRLEMLPRGRDGQAVPAGKQLHDDRLPESVILPDQVLHRQGDA